MKTDSSTRLVRRLAFALAFCAALALTACGNDSPPTTAPVPDTSAPATSNVSTDNGAVSTISVSGTPTGSPVANTPAPPVPTDTIVVLPDPPTPTAMPIVNTPALAVQTTAPAAVGISRMYAATIGGFYSINPDTLAYTQLLSIDTPDRPGHVMALSPDKRTLYLLDENIDRISETQKAAVGVRYLDAQAGKLIKTVRYTYTHDGRNYNTLVMSGDGKQLYLIGLMPTADTIVTVLNSADGSKTDEYTLKGYGMVTGSALFMYNALVDTANNHLIVSYSIGGSSIYDLAAPHNLVARLETTRGSIIISPNGYLLAARGGDGDPVGVYDQKTGASVGTLITNAAGQEVDLQYGPDGQRLFTLTENCYVINPNVVTPSVPGFTMNQGQHGFREINLMSREVKGQDGVMCGTRLAVDPNGTKVFAADKKLIQRFDLTYYTVEKSATMPSRVWDLLIVSK